MTEGGRFKLVGLEAFRAFKYRPQALQIVAPCGDRLHKGVLLVPQLLRGLVEFTEIGTVLTCTLAQLV